MGKMGRPELRDLCLVGRRSRKREVIGLLCLYVQNAVPNPPKPTPHHSMSSILT
jgi:hypothetical protein